MTFRAFIVPFMHINCKVKKKKSTSFDFGTKILSLSLWTSEVDQMPIWSDVDQILLSKFTSMTSDGRISDQLLMSKGTGSLNVFAEEKLEKQIIF